MLVLRRIQRTTALK